MQQSAHTMTEAEWYRWQEALAEMIEAGDARAPREAAEVSVNTLLVVAATLRTHVRAHRSRARTRALLEDGVLGREESIARYLGDETPPLRLRESPKIIPLRRNVARST